MIRYGWHHTIQAASHPVLKACRRHGLARCIGLAQAYHPPIPMASRAEQSLIFLHSAPPDDFGAISVDHAGTLAGPITTASEQEAIAMTEEGHCPTTQCNDQLHGTSCMRRSQHCIFRIFWSFHWASGLAIAARVIGPSPNSNDGSNSPRSNRMRYSRSPSVLGST